MKGGKAQRGQGMADNIANTDSIAAKASDASRRRRDSIRAATKRGGRSKAAGAKPDEKVVAEHSKIFVAYAREDREPTRALVERLRRSGADVTWDEDFAAGVDVGRTIRRAITEAKAVIVVWSTSSAHSLYVRDEANLALKDNKLLPTHIDGFDPEEVPMGFGQLHTVAIETPGLVETSLARLGIALDTDEA